MENDNEKKGGGLNRESTIMMFFLVAALIFALIMKQWQVYQVREIAGQFQALILQSMDNTDKCTNLLKAEYPQGGK